ncbi:hypothetical protein Droror1_Dr00019394 [Drosera rotundifolia]
MLQPCLKSHFSSWNFFLFVPGIPKRLSSCSRLIHCDPDTVRKWQPPKNPRQMAIKWCLLRPKRRNCGEPVVTAKLLGPVLDNGRGMLCRDSLFLMQSDRSVL